MRKPRYFNTRFGEIVKEAYSSGSLNWENVREWEIEYNGFDPKGSLNTAEIMDYLRRYYPKILEGEMR
jgi:hypothetical protein